MTTDTVRRDAVREVIDHLDECGYHAAAEHLREATHEPHDHREEN